VTKQIADFLEELRSKCGQPELINKLEQLMRQVDSWAEGGDSGLEDFRQAVAAIVGTNRTTREKIASLHKLCNTPDNIMGHA
jgi:hypothetical protein